MVTSPLLRRKILSMKAPGGRSVGMAQLGATHVWRQYPRDRSLGAGDHEGNKIDADMSRLVPSYAKKMSKTISGDHNWPKVDPVKGMLSRTGVLPVPVEKMMMDPTKSKSKRWTIPKSRRFKPLEKDCAPGPGSYGQQLSTTHVFHSPNKEIVIAGANHCYPWKTWMLAENTMTGGKFDTPPMYTFSKMRRCASDAYTGQMASTGAVKTDMFGMAPGPIYNAYTMTHPKGFIGESIPTRPARANSFRMLADGSRTVMGSPSASSMIGHCYA